MKHINRHLRLLPAVAGLTLMAGLAVAQPEARRERTPGGPDKVAAPDRAIDPAVIRERLERRAAELEGELARLHEAIGAVDEGAPPQDVFRILRPPMPEGRPDGFNARDKRHDWRPQGGPNDRRPMGGMGPMTPEERERIVEFVKVNMPRIAERLEQLQTDRPEVAERVLQGLRDRVAEFRRLAEENPEAIGTRLDALRTDMEIRHVAMEFVEARRADDQAAVNEARTALEGLVAERVEISLKERERELVILRERIDRLQAEIAEASANPQEIAARRLDELLTRLENAPAKADDGQRRFRQPKPE